MKCIICDLSVIATKFPLILPVVNTVMKVNLLYKKARNFLSSANLK
jgi:hypothetical protein